MESEELVLQDNVVCQATNLGVCNFNTSVYFSGQIADFVILSFFD